MIDITGLREDKRPQSSTIVHALLDRLEAAEKERDAAELMSLALRAKIEAMERQEPVAKVRVHQIGAGGYRDIGTDLTDDALAAIHMLGIIRKYGVNGCLPAQNVPDFADAYQGAMEEVAIWKKRALEAEDLNRKFIAEINGPMLMGEPVAQPAPSAPSEEAAAEMGANGGHVVEAERLAFEAWMRGHCWELGAKWTGTEYRSAFEKGGMVDTHAMRTRELWAAWRDRAALAAPKPEAKP